MTENKDVMIEDSHPIEDLRFQIKGLSSPRRFFAFLAVSVLGFCLVVNSAWKPSPDSALYLALGESLAEGNGYVFNGEPHTFVPPGFPLLVSAVSRIFGSDFLAYRMLMALTGLLAVIAGYILILRLYGPDIALFAGGLFAVNHVLLVNSTRTLSDVPFALFTFVALNGAITAARTSRLSWTIVAGLLAALTPLFRINGLAVPLAVAFFLFCSWGKLAPQRKILYLAVFLVVSYAPYAMWDYWKSTFPVSPSEGSYLGTVTGRDFGYQLGVIFGALWDYAAETSYALTGVVLKTGFLELIAPAIVALGLVLAWRSGDRLLVPLTVIQYAGLLLSSAGSRYIIFLLPGLYVFLAIGLARICREASERVTKRGRRFPAPRSILAGCLAILAIFNVGHNLVTVYGARTAAGPYGAESARGVPFFTAAQWLKTHAPGSTVLTMHPRVLHYLSGCPTVTLLRSGVPVDRIWVRDEETIRKLIRENNPSFLFTDSKNADFYNDVIKGVEAAGVSLEEIPQASSSKRYRLWRMTRPSAEVNG